MIGMFYSEFESILIPIRLRIKIIECSLLRSDSHSESNSGSWRESNKNWIWCSANLTTPMSRSISTSQLDSGLLIYTNISLIRAWPTFQLFWLETHEHDPTSETHTWPSRTWPYVGVNQQPRLDYPRLYKNGFLLLISFLDWRLSKFIDLYLVGEIRIWTSDFFVNPRRLCTLLHKQWGEGVGATMVSHQWRWIQPKFPKWEMMKEFQQFWEMVGFTFWLDIMEIIRSILRQFHKVLIRSYATWHSFTN